MLDGTDADWATGNTVIMDANGDRQPDFWLWNLGSGSVYIPAMKIVFDMSNGNIFSVIQHLYIMAILNPDWMFHFVDPLTYMLTF